MEQPPQPQPSHPATSTSPSQVITRRAPRRSIQQQEEANTKYSFDSVVELFIYFRHMHCKTIAPSPSYVNLSSRIFSIPHLAVPAHCACTPHMYDFYGRLRHDPTMYNRESVELIRYGQLLLSSPSPNETESRGLEEHTVDCRVSQNTTIHNVFQKRETQSCTTCHSGCQSPQISCCLWRLAATATCYFYSFYYYFYS